MHSPPYLPFAMASLLDSQLSGPTLLSSCLLCLPITLLLSGVTSTFFCVQMNLASLPDTTSIHFPSYMKLSMEDIYSLHSCYFATPILLPIGLLPTVPSIWKLHDTLDC